MTNIYEQPQSDVGMENSPAFDLDKSELKSIINSWHRLIVLCCFWFLAFITCLAVFIPTISGDPQTFYIGIFFGILGLVYLASMIGTLFKTAWGRYMGMTVCVFMLLGIPIGTVLGIMGLFGYDGAKKLFGKDALSIKAVKSAYKVKKNSQ